MKYIIFSLLAVFQIHAGFVGQKVCERYALDPKAYKKVFTDRYFQSLKPHKFALITPQKSGTNLIQKCISLITGKLPVDHSIVKSRGLPKLLSYCKKNNQFLFMHVSDTSTIEKLDDSFAKLTILRDPRDKIISRIFFFDKIQNGPRGLEFNIWRAMSFDEKIDYLISNEKAHNFFSANVENFTGYHVIRFEDLVGSQGGGSRKNQILSIIKIARALGIELNSHQLLYITRHLFGNTNTFRKGVIGDWKNYFDSHKEHCKEVLGDLLIDLGYEKDYNW